MASEPHWSRLLSSVLAIACAIGPQARFAFAAPQATEGATRSSDEARDGARASFVLGTQLAEAAKWAEALAAFEKAQSLSPHAVTLFNIANCERALGRYLLARRTFREALAAHEKGVGTLPGTLVDETKAYVDETNKLVARVQIELDPADARVAVDGRPLAWERRGSEWVALAGVRPAAGSEGAKHTTFVLEADPGVRVIALDKPGFSEVFERRTLTSGDNGTLRLSLTRLPATVRVAASEPDALVFLGGRDLGPAPIEVRRSPGAYDLIVEKDGFEPYRAKLELSPGEQVALRANLAAEEPSVLERWWFWTIAGTVVTGAAVATYFAARPEPERATVGEGTLGWRVPLP